VTLLAIAAVLDGASREEAATIGGMDRQTLRDWLIRFNEQGPDGLINIPSPGVPPKLNSRHKTFLARIVDEGSDPCDPWRGALAGVRSHHAAV
jgi:transposase